MGFLAKILTILDWEMTKPEMYGWFHILWLVLTVAATVFLCKFFKEGTEKQVHRVVFITAIIVIAMEIYKQINYTFIVSDGVINSDYQWYIFPFQFCSMPMFVGFLAGVLKKGKIRDALLAFLATYAVFAGTSVMLYPSTVFIKTIGINIQTMFCHGSMIVVGVYLLYTGYVKVKLSTILKAMPVFAVAVSTAAVLNEIANACGINETETFNMFFISPYCEPSLPVYSIVQQYVPFPLSLVIYILGFTAAAFIILAIAVGVKSIFDKKTTLSQTVENEESNNEKVSKIS